MFCFMVMKLWSFTKLLTIFAILVYVKSLQSVHYTLLAEDNFNQIHFIYIASNHSKSHFKALNKRINRSKQNLIVLSLYWLPEDSEFVVKFYFYHIKPWLWQLGGHHWGLIVLRLQVCIRKSIYCQTVVRFFLRVS